MISSVIGDDAEADVLIRDNLDRTDGGDVEG